MAEYEVIISYTTGDQDSFIGEKGGLDIVHLYRTQYENTSEVAGLQGFNEFNELIKIYSSLREENAWYNYTSFKQFCENNVLKIDKDTVANITIKDNYGNVYYNILADQIIGLDIRGTTNELDVLSFELYIYLKGE